MVITPPPPRVLPAVLLVESITVGLPENWQRGCWNKFGGINLDRITGKLGWVLRRSTARPLPECRGRAASPVACLSVWFIPRAVNISAASRGSSVSSYCLGILKGTQVVKQSFPDVQNSHRNPHKIQGIFSHSGMRAILGICNVLSWDLATRNVSVAAQCEAM